MWESAWRGSVIFFPNFLLTVVFTLFHSPSAIYTKGTILCKLSILLVVSVVFLCVEAQNHKAINFVSYWEVRNVFLIFYFMFSTDYLIALFGGEFYCLLQGAQYSSLTYQSLFVVNVFPLHIPSMIPSLFISHSILLTIHLPFPTWNVKLHHKHKNQTAVCLLVPLHHFVILSYTGIPWRY